jgi:NitT/TauT family transport system substrate-binding protein
VNTLGVLYIVEKGGETVQSIEDLKGKTIYAHGKGATPEYALAYLLEQKGMNLETDVTMSWKNEAAEVVAAMATEEQAVAMLPQPFVTVASAQLENLRVALDLTKEWDALNNGSQLITGGLVIRKAFAEEHPEAVAAFLKEYAASTAFTNEQPAEAAQLIAKYDIIKAAVAQKAIPFCNIVCITGEEMQRIALGYYQTLFDQNPAAVGGAMPDDGLFLKAE